LLALLGVFVFAVAAREAGAAPRGTVVAMRSSPIAHAKTFVLARPATHVALYWRGKPDAVVRVRFSREGTHFGVGQRVRIDEIGEQLRDGTTYGAVIAAPGVWAVRISTTIPLARLTVLALTDRGEMAALRAGASASVRRAAALAGRGTASSSAVTTSGVAQPTVIARAGWAANESLRFDASGKEIWPPAFYPIQKLIVHHTATQNNDPDPAATIRSIYYYHAVTQGWGDIGYNFLIDEAGNVYEGRYSRPYAPGESPTGEDSNGNGVTAAHAQGYNSGTVGIALLGTLTDRDATPAARDALVRLLAWIADGHGIDPRGAALYVNPVSGLQATFPNIAGHRDVAATECPGASFYATLPAIRADVAARIAQAAPDFTLAASPSSVSTGQGGTASSTVSVTSANGFTGSVDLSVTGLPVGASATFTPANVVAPGSSQLTVTTSSSTPPGSYSLTITGASGPTTRSTTLTLGVNPPPDFTLSVSPSSRSIRRGRNTSYAITVGSQQGFAGAVFLSLDGLPAGATSSFAPSSLVAPGSSTLRVTTSSSATRGTYTLIIRGSSGAISHAVTTSLTVR
jgi:hypothetical protein